MPATQAFTSLQVDEITESILRNHGAARPYLSRQAQAYLVDSVVLRIVLMSPVAIEPADVRSLHERVNERLANFGFWPHE